MEYSWHMGNHRTRHSAGGAGSRGIPSVGLLWVRCQTVLNVELGSGPCVGVVLLQANLANNRLALVMARSILAPFKKFSNEGSAVGRLLAGYSNIEVGLLNCVQMACGGDLDTVLKRMFRIRGEMRRIDEAEKLGHLGYQRLGLAGDFQKAI